MAPDTSRALAFPGDFFGCREARTFADPTAAHSYAIEATHAGDPDDVLVTIVVHADTPEAARAVARANGYFVQSCVLGSFL